MLCSEEHNLIVATAVIALLFFSEAIGKRLWCAIILITLSSILLTLDTAEGVSFSFGSLLVLSAAICRGVENNCTRQIADKDPLQIVMVKGVGSGLAALVVALVIGEKFSSVGWIVATMQLGFLSYGLSIYYYTYAQRVIGAARTSAYYAVAPFIGAVLSMLILGERPELLFFIALVIMFAGTFIASKKM
ncbi:MAG: DMT family transporter [Bacteroidales bacterium]|nr:DMT family transporter [Bacteroidales bacterium]